MSRPTLRDVAGLPAALSVDEAAEVLGVGRQTVYDSVKAGEIYAVKVRGRLLIPSAPLLRLLGLDDLLGPVVSRPGDGAGEPSPSHGAAAPRLEVASGAAAPQATPETLGAAAPRVEVGFGAAAPTFPLGDARGRGSERPARLCPAEHEVPQ